MIEFVGVRTFVFKPLSRGLHGGHSVDKHGPKTKYHLGLFNLHLGNVFKAVSNAQRSDHRLNLPFRNCTICMKFHAICDCIPKAAVAWLKDCEPTAWIYLSNGNMKVHELSIIAAPVCVRTEQGRKSQREPDSCGHPPPPPSDSIWYV